MKISKEIKLALLSIVALLMFVFGYNYLKGSGLLSSSRKIFVEYDNVQGLTPANYVQWQGYNIGSVKNISLSKNNPGKILVELSLGNEMQVPVDSRAEIISMDFLGTKAVSIVKGTSSENVKSGQMLAGSMAIGAIDKLSSAAVPAVDGVTQTLSSINQTVAQVNNVIDAKTQAHIKSVVGNLDQTTAEFSAFSKELNAQRGKISVLLNNLNTFTDNLNKNNSNINNIIKNAETASASFSKLELQSTVNELKSTLDNLQTTLDKVNNGKGSLAMLMNDDKLYRNLKNTLATANNLIYDINARPSRYIHVSVFGKKQKNEAPPSPAPNSNE